MVKKSFELTLLDIVRHVQDSARTDAEVVAVLTHLIHTRRVVRRTTPRR